MSGPEPDGAQALVAKAFANGEVAGAGPLEARIDTHLSHVFLTHDRAYKLKRAVRLPFVDFSTLEQRQAGCEAELAVNQAWAAALYEGVAAIRRDGERFSLGGEGEIIDWVVRMRRFSPGAQFDELGDAGKLSTDLLEATAAMIASHHTRGVPNLLMGHAADYRALISGLRRTEADGAARLGVAPAAPHVFERLEQELARIGSLIEARRAAGKVRRGHGDLHLRNLCLFDGAPLAFDALEFDERLSTTDVLYDFAFLLMDLRKRGLNTQANAALNAYWDAAGEDEAALKLMPFFTGLRAAVRMAVAVEAGALGEADAYRRFAIELVAPSSPIHIAIGGLSGSGKSVVARAVAPLLGGPAGARLLRSDILRKRVTPIAERYASQTVMYVYEQLAHRARQAVEAGASVIVDATFQHAQGRESLAAVWRTPWRGYWLDAPRSVRLERVALRRNDASDADVAVAAAQPEPADLPAPWRRINANQAVAAVAADILKDLQVEHP